MREADSGALSAAPSSSLDRATCRLGLTNENVDRWIETTLMPPGGTLPAFPLAIGLHATIAAVDPASRPSGAGMGGSAEPLGAELALPVADVDAVSPSPARFVQTAMVAMKVRGDGSGRSHALEFQTHPFALSVVDDWLSVRGRAGGFPDSPR